MMVCSPSPDRNVSMLRANETRYFCASSALTDSSGGKSRSMIPIDRKEAKAELDNGLLRIILAEASSKSEPSHIPIL